ncbi:hypothetical protein M433DRAFT_152627 [Acidomyces richmondensis BFW]|nr:MAG: hypothetical protein FE78DRAFT_89111 [Acidomyces sp. 'richmondensis']KYG47092.1 hypothetical protein M433DRAFT_152627 [Acidomyces richmondensis BFW]
MPSWQQPQIERRPAISTLSSIRLVSLPTELLLEVASYLPLSAIISMKLVNKRLYHAIPIPRDYNIFRLVQCERDAVRRAINEHIDRRTARKRCVVCNTLQPLCWFRNCSTPICSWHDGRFMKSVVPVAVDGGIKFQYYKLVDAATETYWLALDRTFCSHCHAILGWEIPECRCACTSCPRITVVVYLRISSEKYGLRSAKLAKNETSHYIVSEEICVHGCSHMQSDQLERADEIRRTEQPASGSHQKRPCLDDRRS